MGLEASSATTFKNASAAAMLTDAQIAQLLDDTSLNNVRTFDMVDSTNDEALAAAKRNDVALPCLFVTWHQTAGRGRGTNRWQTSEGALTFSVLYDANELGAGFSLSINEIGAVGMWIALAVRDAIAAVIGDFDKPVQVKWPNDVLVGGSKVAGILIDVAKLPQPRAIVGVGINVNNDPAPALELATSLQQCAGAPQSLFHVLHETLSAIDEVSRSAAALSSRWQPHDFLLGRRVETNQGIGIAGGVTDEGALILETDDGLQHVHSGSIYLTSD